MATLVDLRESRLDVDGRFTYVEPDGFTLQDGTLTIVGRSGILLDAAARGVNHLWGTRIDGTGGLKHLHAPEARSLGRLVRAVERDGETLLVASGSGSRDSSWTLRVHTARAGRWDGGRTHVLPVRPPSAQGVTALVPSRTGAWFASINRAGANDVAIVVRFEGETVLVDSVPLLYLPTSLQAVEDPSSDTVTLVYSALRALGRGAPPEVVATRWDRAARTAEHQVIGNGDGRRQDGITVVGSGPAWHVFWGLGPMNATELTHLGGARTTDGGATWRPLPSIELPAGVWGFRATSFGRDSVVLATFTMPARDALLVALLAGDRWAGLHHEPRATTTSRPIPMPLHGGRVGLVFGTVDGPATTTIPSLSLRSGRWACPPLSAAAPPGSPRTGY